MAARELVRAYNRRLRPYGITYIHYFILLLLEGGGGIRPSDLGAELRLDPSSLTGHLDRMEQAGFVERRSDPDDRRVIRIYLTERGVALERELRSVGDELREWTHPSATGGAEAATVRQSLQEMAGRLEAFGDASVRPAGPGRLRIGIDVGGTFTDLVALDEASGTLEKLKVPTTPQAPERGVINALATFIERMPDREISLVSHSSTIATNALLGQVHLELPRIALLTTEGFRDVLEIGRQQRSEVYNLFVNRPRPLVPREHRIGVKERMDYRGQAIVPLDRKSLDAAIAHLVRHDVRTIAVSFLHAYANPEHERAVLAAIRKKLPEADVVLSSDIDPEYREYERTSTTVVNALLIPLVRRYLERLDTDVRAMGIDAPIFVMQSNGGMAAIDVAAERPATIIESGPAAGVIGAAFLGRKLGVDNVLSFDMGGTTAKAGTIVGGVPEIVGEFEAAGRTHSGRAVKGSGYPVRFPFIDLAEISAGGGTIAWIDAGGALRVGPLSAGADPGPAAYGKGEQPTVTDANLVLGRLNPRALLGGAMPIAIERSRAAVASLGGALPGMGIDAIASGIVELVDAEMAKVLRIVSIERGYDPRNFSMMAFGGGGPLHACALAEELGVPRVIVPTDPGLFSAYGLLAADLKAAFVQSIVKIAGDLDPAELEAAFARLEARGRHELERQNIEPDEIAFVREIDARYLGQGFELPVEAASTLDAKAIEHVVDAFHQRHERVYGYASRDESVEFVAARVTAIGYVPKPPLPVQAGLAESEPLAEALLERRDVYFASAGRVSTPVYARAGLAAGNRLTGPAIVEQYDSCTLIPPKWRLRVDTLGNLNIEKSHG